MFNLQSIAQMATQALLRKLVSSDEMFNQWQAFSKKMGIPQTSRAEFDSLVNQFNSTDSNTKMSQLQNANPAMLQKLMDSMMK